MVFRSLAELREYQDQQMTIFNKQVDYRFESSKEFDDQRLAVSAGFRRRLIAQHQAEVQQFLASSGAQNQ